MATARSISTDDYKLFPSPRNQHRALFEFQVFVPYPYMLIEVESYNLTGKFSLFAACRLSDGKMGQLVSMELAEDEQRFKERFIPD